MATKKEQISRRTQEERRAEAEEALIRSALELISTNGVARTSLAEIGQRAGYSRGLASHYFGSKDSLINQLISHARRKYLQRIRGQRAGTGAEALVMGADEYVKEHYDPNPATPALIVMWGATLPQGANNTEAIAQADESARRIIRKTIAQGQRDGSISKDVDAEGFSVAYLGMLRGIAAQALISPELMKPRKIRAELKRFIGAALSGSAPGC